MVLSRKKIRVAIREALILMIGVPIIVFGTYGTSRGMAATGTIYLKYAFPAAILVIAALLSRDLIKRGRISLLAFGMKEIQLFQLVSLLILISTFGLPQYILTALLTVLAAFLGVLYVTNRVDCEERFLSMFASYQRLIYVTTLLALITGLYSFYFGSLHFGPIVIRYNKLFWRINSWYVSSTGLGLFLCHGIFSAYYFILKSRSSLSRAIHAAVIPGFIYGMALAGGRTGFFAMIAAFFFLWVAKNWPFRLVTWVKLFFMVSLFASVLFYLLHNFSRQIYFLRRLQSDTGSLGGRTGFLAHAWNDLGHFSYYQLFFGVGVNGSQETLLWSTSVHSGMLRFMLEYGFLMLIVYVLFCITTLSGLFRRAGGCGKFQPEGAVLLISMTSFVIAEFMVIQLFGISIEFLMFTATLAFSAALKKFSTLPPNV